MIDIKEEKSPMEIINDIGVMSLYQDWWEEARALAKEYDNKRIALNTNFSDAILRAGNQKEHLAELIKLVTDANCPKPAFRLEKEIR